MAAAAAALSSSHYLSILYFFFASAAIQVLLETPAAAKKNMLMSLVKTFAHPSTVGSIYKRRACNHGNYYFWEGRTLSSFPYFLSNDSPSPFFYMQMTQRYIKAFTLLLFSKVSDT